MIDYFILVLSTLLATGKALFCKALGMGNYTKKETAVLNFKSFLVAAACALLFVIGKAEQLISISSFSLTLSVIFGFVVALTQIMQAKAMGTGATSIVSLIYSCGFLIPIFYGLAFLNEGVSAFQWLGIAVLIVALYLIVYKGGVKSKTLIWLPFAVIAMIGSGTNAVFQKIHQLSEHKDELFVFVVYALFFSAVFTGIASLIIVDNGHSSSEITKKQKAFKNIIIPLGLGISVGLLNFTNLFLAGKLPSVIHFPIFNVGSMLLASGISAFIYKDMPTKRQGVGFVIGVAAILIIGIL